MFVEKMKSVEWMDYALLSMSIIPIPQGMKRPDYKWARLRYTKTWVLLDTDSGTRMLERFFALGGGGLAVVCGRPSENLFVIDCDTVEALHECRRQLWARGIDAPTVWSSRGGHLYLRAREGAVKTIAAGVVAGVEIRGDGALVVLPPTRHESGVYYRWDRGNPPRNIPTVSIHDIDFLVGADGQTVKLKTSTGERRLHDQTRDYLERGAKLAQGTRNSRLFDAARDYKFVGKGTDAALHDLLPVAVASGLSEREAAATILSPFKKPSPLTPLPNAALGEGNYQQKNNQAALDAFVETMQWAGRTGNTDKRVMAALIQRRKEDAHRHGDGVFRASYRELMLLAKFNSWRTIYRSIERLKCLGFVEAVGQDTSTATLWRISSLVMNAGHFFMVQKDTLIQQFSLRSNYCGHFAQRILNLLKENGITSRAANLGTAEIATAVGCHRTTASRHLKHFVEVGLVAFDGTGYRAIEGHVVDSKVYEADQVRAARIAREQAMFAVSRPLEYLWKKNREKTL